MGATLDSVARNGEMLLDKSVLRLVLFPDSCEIILNGSEV
jgi:hypothetical protein